MIVTPVTLNSTTLRVTTVKPRARVAAAIKASRSGFGSGTCSPAQCITTSRSTGRTRPANAVRTWSSNHADKTAACAESRRSTWSTPILISRMVRAETKSSLASTVAAQARTAASQSGFRSSDTTLVSSRYTYEKSGTLKPLISSRGGSKSVSSRMTSNSAISGRSLVNSRN